MGDDDFGVRAYINGFKSISNPFASRQHIKVQSRRSKRVGELGRIETCELDASKANTKYFISF